ncbi:hypothetical protein Tco_0480712 [Tanacetum coccineum]
MFKINPFKTSREDTFVPINKVRARIRTNLITVSQPHVITKTHVNSDSNGLFSTRVENTGKTRRPQPMSNTKNDRVPYASRSSCIKNKQVEVKEHHMNLLLSTNKKHMSSGCNNIKLAIRNDKSEVVCAMFFLMKAEKLTLVDYFCVKRLQSNREFDEVLNFGRESLLIRLSISEYLVGILSNSGKLSRDL